MSNIDPDAPWWANLLLLAFVATVPVVITWKTARRSARAAEGSQAIATRTEAQMARVLHNVENDHSIGLRDDFDKQIKGVTEAVAGLVQEHRATHDILETQGQELRGIRADVAGVHDDIRLARADRRILNERIGAVEEHVRENPTCPLQPTDADVG